MTKLRRYNIQIPDLLQDLGSVFSGGAFDHADGRAAFVVPRSGSQPQLLLAKITLGRGVGSPRREDAYPELILAAESVGIGDFLADLRVCIQERRLTIVGYEVEMKTTTSYEFYGSGNAYSGSLPCYVCELESTTGRILPSGGPLLQFGLPAYDSVEEALRTWVGLRPFHGSSDARLGKVIVVVPLQGPRFGKLEFVRDKSLKVQVDHASGDAKIELKGVWQSGAGASVTDFSEQVTSEGLEVPCPKQAEGLSLWLINSKSEILDSFQESPQRCSRVERVLHLPEPRSGIYGGGESEPDLLAEIRAGECETVEFKPFIRGGDPKMDEIVRTSIACANTRGGRIYIGINDLQEVDGIDREVIKACARTGGHSLKEGAERYCKIIAKALTDRSNKALEAVIEPKEIAGKTVIRVSVPEGRNKPYSDVKTHEIWIRRGSNTVRPDPERDLRGLLQDDTRLRLSSDEGIFDGPTS
jgi:hypothetical protein